MVWRWKGRVEGEPMNGPGKDTKAVMCTRWRADGVDGKAVRDEC